MRCDKQREKRRSISAVRVPGNQRRPLETAGGTTGCLANGTAANQRARLCTTLQCLPSLISPFPLHEDVRCKHEVPACAFFAALSINLMMHARCHNTKQNKSRNSLKLRDTDRNFKGERKTKNEAKKHISCDGQPWIHCAVGASLSSRGHHQGPVPEREVQPPQGVRGAGPPEGHVCQPQEAGAQVGGSSKSHQTYTASGWARVRRGPSAPLCGDGVSGCTSVKSLSVSGWRPID